MFTNNVELCTSRREGNSLVDKEQKLANERTPASGFCIWVAYSGGFRQKHSTTCDCQLIPRILGKISSCGPFTSEDSRENLFCSFLVCLLPLFHFNFYC